jgi:hypothetical protein
LEQNAFLSRAVGLLENSQTCSDPQFNSLYKFLRSEIVQSASERDKLTDRIKQAKLSNFKDYEEERALNSIVLDPRLNPEARASLRISFAEKVKALNLSYERQLLASDELKFLLEAQSEEEDLFSRFAQITDQAIDELKARVQEKKVQLSQVERSLKHLKRDGESLTSQISDKFAKCQFIADFLNEHSHNDELLQSVAALFGMLQSPAATDEQIRLGMDSVIAIARLRAHSEQTKRKVPLSPIKHESLASTLEVLRQKLEARRLS